MGGGDGLEAGPGPAWFVASALVALALVALQWYVGWLYLDLVVPLDAVAFDQLGGAALGVGLLVGRTVGLVGAWQAKLVGEQTLLVMTW